MGYVTVRSRARLRNPVQGPPLSSHGPGAGAWQTAVPAEPPVAGLRLGEP